MKKHTQRQLLGLLKSIVKGITYIKENTQTNQTETVYNDCNAATNMVRNTVESELPEQSAISYTKLCEKVIKDLAESAKIQDETKKKKLLDEAICALHDLDSTLQSETEINKEIVFFPYKASMWDSLESIWRAAMEDPRCDCYVVPIPYFTNGKMEFEGHLFPKDVPVIHYSLYKMDVQLPDITYIHNPYDNYNKVSQVDPSYFTSELKKYTKKLVYVPYFVVEVAISDHLCNLPSMKNIDLVVVQSEQVRDVYIKYVSPDKVVALGSPKFDKVVNNRANGVEIPKNWEEKINGKKVVLYNTSLAGLLENTPAYLKKLNSVIEDFSRNEEVVLLWRPHPLMKSTFQSMRPDFLPFYQQIEQFFIQSNTGILDLSTDPHLAVAVADAYYGDPSSMYPLFAATGKPVVLHDITLPEGLDSNKSFLGFEALAMKDEKTMYGFSEDLNALCQIDLVTGSVIFLGSIPNQQFSTRYLCISMEIVGDTIILVPYADKYESGEVQFVEYSIANNTFTLRDLQGKELFQTPWKENLQGLFNSSFKLGNSVFFVPYHYGAIVEYNVETSTCTYHEAPLACLDENTVQNAYFRRFGCQTGSDLYLPLVDSNLVLKFSMESGEFNWLKIGKKESRFSSCYADGKSLWLVSFIDGSVTKYDITKSRVEGQGKALKGMQKYNAEGEVFGSVINCGSKLLLAPAFSNSAAIYHMTSKKVETSDVLPVSFPAIKGQYSKAVHHDGSMYFFNNSSRNIVKYDLTTNEKEEIRLTISAQELEMLCDKRFNGLSLHPTSQGKPGYLQEFNFSELLNNSSIANYLEALMGHVDNVEGQKEYMQCISVNLDGTSGENIHRHVSEMLENK